MTLATIPAALGRRLWGLMTRVQREFWEILLTPVLSLAALWLALEYLHDFVTAVYAALLAALVATRLWRWPRVRWLGIDQVETRRSAWAEQPLGVKLTPADAVRRLANRRPAEHYFVGGWIQANSHTLTRELDQELTKKLIGYALFMIFPIAGRFAPTHGEVAPLELFLKVSGTLVFFAAPLVWDYSSWERQRTTNLEYPLPD